MEKSPSSGMLNQALALSISILVLYIIKVTTRNPKALKLRFKTPNNLGAATVSLSNAQTAQGLQWEVSLTLFIDCEEFFLKYFFIAISKNPFENQNRGLKIR